MHPAVKKTLFKLCWVWLFWSLLWMLTLNKYHNIIWSVEKPTLFFHINCWKNNPFYLFSCTSIIAIFEYKWPPLDYIILSTALLYQPRMFNDFLAITRVHLIYIKLKCHLIGTLEDLFFQTLSYCHYYNPNYGYFCRLFKNTKLGFLS